jgi:NAD(P)H-hydrate epimerase
MREWEQATWASGQTEAEVIRRVGKSVADLALHLTQPGDFILILAGKGNNGADARAALEHLAQRRAELLIVTDPTVAVSKLEGFFSGQTQGTPKPALIIDGLFGIGLNRPLSSDWVDFIDRVNDSPIPILSVDVPSGLNAETGLPEGSAIRASITLTVGSPKLAMLAESSCEYVGRLEVASDVGLIPCPHRSDFQWTLPEDFTGFPPPRPVASHKGTYGHAALLAGSLGYHGAAVLAARGAQRAQPGLITLFTMEQTYQPVASQLQAVMVSPWHPNFELPQNTTAIMAGPGLAAPDMPEELKLWVRHQWRGAPVPMLVDASALAWIRSEPVPRHAARVLTPHPGEAARLLGMTSKDLQADRVHALRRLSASFGNAFIVLKGHHTLIGQSAGPIFINPSGNPHLAQGGSGDTLSGYIAGLLAQPTLARDPLTLIRYAVYQHGSAADKLQASRHNWAVEDLLDELGRGSQ